MRYNPHKTQKQPPLPKGTIPAAQSTIRNPRSEIPILVENTKLNGIELHFPTKPSETIIQSFRGTKSLPPDDQWHFHFKGKIWYARDNPITRAFAQSLIVKGS